MNIENVLAPKIQQVLESLYQNPIDANLIQLQKTKKEFEGDITLVIFPFSKMAKKSPAETAQEIGEALAKSIDIISAFNVVQGFLNISIHDKFWIQQLQAIHLNSSFGFAPQSANQLMVEYSSPNTNKPLHLGHLRNNFLGYSVAEILKANGNDVVKTQIINDRGIHICKSMLAWVRYGNNETPESSKLKGDKLVGKYYVEFDKAMREESKQILAKWEAGNFTNVPADISTEYRRLKQAWEEKEDEKNRKGIEGKMKELANSQTPIMADVKEMLLKWEAGDKEVFALWQKMNGWVYDGFALTYKTMGVDFHKLYYESDTYVYGKSMVEEGLAKNVFFKKPDGSVWVDLTDEGLDEKIVLRSDGTAVYMTQDIGTARQRFIDYPKLNGIIYTVGNEQDYHFKVLFLILKKLGYAWAQNCYHLSYGMVDLPSGKMKSREGTVVDADDLMDEVIAKAKEMTQERGHIDGMDETEKENLYRMIGLGGLKYYLLKVDPKKRMLFDPAESVDLNGNTGPFIQYAHARIASLLRKADEIGLADDSVSIEDSERELIKHLAHYPVVVKEAGAEYSPALLANYTYDLVKHYNSFYQSVSIFKEDDLAKRNLRLVLSMNVGKVIKSSMSLLGIEVPERM
ncbi:MAG: arginine--tRNA ligase [Crocinitomicaceae bacterium]|nr:arginine--tRNA ligase [Crocinitomicaceae bacterium]